MTGERTAMQRPPVVEATWTDPVTGTHGYLVVNTLVRGLTSGGLRVRAGCTLDEVRGLARAMTLKEALAYDPADAYVPLGGAKGAVDLDPDDPRKPQVLGRFLRDLLPTVREQWSLGEDFGVRQATLETIAAELGLASTVEPVIAQVDDPEGARRRIKDAFAVDVDGIALDELVGGYGVARATEAYLESQGRKLAGSTAVVQGFGSIGGATARYLAGGGASVVGVADRNGLIVDENGLDVEALLRARDGDGRIDRDQLTGVTLRHREEWLDVPCDVLVPAAVSYAIGEKDAPRVCANLVVEGANMPTLPVAEAALAERGVPVLPDFLANVGTNAWWYWLVFGDVPAAAEPSFAKIAALMQRLVRTTTVDVAAGGGTLRDAAHALVDHNLAALEERFAR